jgi:hypothetical protein
MRYPQLFATLLFAVTLGARPTLAQPPADLVAQGRQAVAAGRIDDAIALFERARAADPNNPAAVAELGSAQVRRARSAPLMEQPGWVERGFRTLDDAVARFPNAAVVYLTRGLTAAAVPDFFNKSAVATDDLRRVIAMKEKDPAAVPDAVMPGVRQTLERLLARGGPAGGAPVAAAPSSGTPAGFPNVLDALRAAPGCLGVETGQTASGRRVIFAWFENKKALVDWYYSDAHQRAMKTLVPDTPERKPLPDLPDDTGNILAIVSVKFAEARIESIGIELYGPLPGGVVVGGRFAPASVKVKGLREMPLPSAPAERRS